MPEDSSLWDIKAGAGIYDIYGLTHNPFPAEPIVSPEGYVTSEQFFESIRERELKEIRDKFLVPTMNGDSTNLWVQGDLGVGKSALLLYVQHIINTKWGNDYIAIFIYSPEAGMQGIYKDFLANLQRVGLDKVVAKLVKVAVQTNPKILKLKKTPALGDDLQNYRDLVKSGSIDTQAILRQLKGIVFKKFPYVDSKFVEPFVNYIQEPEETLEDLRNRRPADRLPLLIALIHLLNIAGYKAIFLLIDQLESGWNRWSKLQKDRFSIDIRELVVRTKPLLAVEVTLHAAIVDDIVTNFPTLLRPLPKSPEREVLIKPFTIEDILKLVEWYLSRARKNPNTGELAPFDEDAVKEIARRKNRNTFKVLEACHDLLLSCAQKKTKVINRETAIKLLGSEGGGQSPPI